LKPSPFTYHRPNAISEAVALLAELGDEAKVLAGGQSLVPLMSMRLAAPAHLIDINHLPGLDKVEVTANHVRVGALARHSHVERDEAAFGAIPLLRQALALVAHPTIRNRGTTVGSLVHGDPSAEMPAVLVLLDGVLEVQSADGSREVPAADFFVGPMETSLRSAELAVAARFARPASGCGSAFVELSRRHGDYAVCGVGALVSTDAELAITSAKVALISVGGGPVLVDVTDAITGSGGGFDLSAVHALLDLAIEPEADIHASAEYRRHLAHVLTSRALGQAQQRGVQSRRNDRAA
jgi:aerobic carbon-monoxide dehydrogenase medium subunit